MMKNKLLIPLIVVSVVGLLVGSSVGGVLISKQIKYTRLTSSFNDLTDDFDEQLELYENQIMVYENLLSEMEQLSETYQDLLNTYNILVGENSDLQDEYDTLLADYDLLMVNYASLYASFVNLQNDYNDLNDQYSSLVNDFNLLESDYTTLLNLYNNLVSEYNLLSNNFDLLLTNFNELQNDYNTLYAYTVTIENQLDVFKDYIRTLTLPLQYSVFAEAVRRYYLPLYLDGKTDKEYYMSYAEFCRDVILHDSQQENSFQTVSNAFSDCLKYGNDTMGLAFHNMYATFWDWLPNWDGYGLSGNEFTDLETITQWCIDEIDYEYDSDITFGQEYFVYEHIKFPVETAFRTMGDCEDQAILAAAYLESCGFETAITIFHDDNHPVYGSFYHACLLVHIEQTALFQFLYPADLWHLNSDPYEGYTWCYLDTTWDIPFGQRISWLDAYSSVPSTIRSRAFCDIDGAIT